MPCRDYRDDPDQQRIDMLTRIACKALTHIEETEDGLEILILQDPELAKWWTAHKEADKREQERIRRDKEDKRIREEALAKLSPEEKKILGLK